MNNASNSPKPSPMLKATGLWQKTSVKGGQYLTGRWGALKVLIMENPGATHEGLCTYV